MSVSASSTESARCLGWRANIRLGAILQIVRQQADVLAPELAEQIPDDLTDTLVDMPSDSRLLLLVQVTEDVWFLAFALPLLSLACFGGSILAARNRRRAWTWSGIGIISVGAIVMAAHAGITWLVLRAFDDGAARDAAGAVWSVFTSDLNDWAVVVAAAGAIMVVAAWWVSGTADLGERLGQSRRLLAPLANAALRLLWVAAWLAIGVFMIVSWENALWMGLRVIITAAGVVFVSGSLAELVRLVDRDRRVGP